MIKRVVEISTAGTYLSVKLGQLIVKQEGEIKGQIPCEDIGVLLIDHQGVSYTHLVFTELLGQGAAVVLCNGTHHPAGMILPLETNTIQTERFRQQINAKEPLKKKLWQQIVRAKIGHQAKLVHYDEGTYKTLLAMQKGSVQAIRTISRHRLRRNTGLFICKMRDSGENGTGGRLTTCSITAIW
jgi:CRISPR/Cas system-associated endonuclease Cas1